MSFFGGGQNTSMLLQIQSAFQSSGMQQASASLSATGRQVAAFTGQLGQIPIAAQKVSLAADQAFQRASAAAIAATRANDRLAVSYQQLQAAAKAAAATQAVGGDKHAAAAAAFQEATGAHRNAQIDVGQAMNRANLAQRAASITATEAAVSTAPPPTAGPDLSETMQKMAAWAAALYAIPGLFNRIAAAGVAALGQIQQFIDRGVNAVRSFIDVLTGAGAQLGAVFEVFASGNPLAGVFAGLSAAWGTLANGAQAMVSIAAGAFSALGGLLAVASHQIGELTGGVIQAAGALGSVLLPEAAPVILLFSAMGAAGQQAFHGIVGAVAQAAGEIAGSLVSSLKEILQLVGTVGSTLLGMLSSIAQQGLAANQMFATADIAFTTMTRSVATATALTRQLQQAAIDTTLQFTDLTRGGQALLAFGFKAQEVTGILRTLGDTAAGRGMEGLQERFQRLVADIGRMKSRGVIEGREVLELQEAGINVRGALKIPVGADLATLKLDVETYLPKLMEALNQQFGGLQKQLMETPAGRLSNIQDAWTILTKTITSGFVEQWNAALKNVLGLFDQLANTDAGRTATAGLQQGFTLVGSLIERLTAQLPGLIEMFSGLVKSGQWDAALNQAQSFFDTVGATARSLWEWFSSHWSSIWDGFVSGARTAFEMVSGVFGALQAVWNHFQEAISSGSGWRAFGEAFKQVADTIMVMLESIAKEVAWATRGPLDRALERVVGTKVMRDRSDTIVSLQYIPIRQAIEATDFGKIGQNVGNGIHQALASVNSSPIGQTAAAGYAAGVLRAQQQMQGTGVPAPARIPIPGTSGGPSPVPFTPKTADEERQSSLLAIQKQERSLGAQLGLYLQLAANAQAYAESIHYGGASAEAVSASLRSQLALQQQLVGKQVEALNLIDTSTAIGQEVWLKQAADLAKAQGEAFKLAEALRTLPIQQAQALLDRTHAQADGLKAATEHAQAYAAAWGNTPAAVALVTAGTAQQLQQLEAQRGAQLALVNAQRAGSKEQLEALAGLTRMNTEAFKLGETLRTLPYQAQADRIQEIAGTWKAIADAAKTHAEFTRAGGSAQREALSTAVSHLGAVQSQRDALTQLLGVQRQGSSEWLKTAGALAGVNQQLDQGRQTLIDMVSRVNEFSQAASLASKMIKLGEALGLPQAQLRNLAAREQAIQFQALDAEKLKLSLIDRGTEAWIKQANVVADLSLKITESQKSINGIGKIGGLTLDQEHPFALGGRAFGRYGAIRGAGHGFAGVHGLGPDFVGGHHALGFDVRTQQALMSTFQSALNPQARRLEDVVPGLNGPGGPALPPGVPEQLSLLTQIRDGIYRVANLPLPVASPAPATYGGPVAAPNYGPPRAASGGAVVVHIHQGAQQHTYSLGTLLEAQDLIRRVYQEQGEEQARKLDEALRAVGLGQ